METQDGGDVKGEVSPRDIVYTQAAGGEEDPNIFHMLDLLFEAMKENPILLEIVNRQYGTRESKEVTLERRVQFDLLQVMLLNKLCKEIIN
ncbi:unnamed protein product [Lactuca saligna]|uniref:Uncharacterized protein n=1 Tax=Lactuca saligna TaxID=75948 RepID=A0AA35ZLW6_LACSI|nr:unnamed protein product [Lactuca saligna]